MTHFRSGNQTMRPQSMRDQQVECETCCCLTTLLIVVVIALGIPGICLVYYFWPIDAMHSRASTLICAYGMRPTEKITCPSEYFKGRTTTQDPLILMFNGSDIKRTLKVCSSTCSQNLRETSQCAIGFGIWMLNNYATLETFNYNGCSLPPDGLYLTGWVFIAITAGSLLCALLCSIPCHKPQRSNPPNQPTESA